MECRHEIIESVVFTVTEEPLNLLPLEEYKVHVAQSALQGRCLWGGRLLPGPGYGFDLFLKITGSKYIKHHCQSSTSFLPFKHDLVIKNIKRLAKLTESWGCRISLCCCGLVMGFIADHLSNTCRKRAGHQTRLWVFVSSHYWVCDVYTLHMVWSTFRHKGTTVWTGPHLHSDTARRENIWMLEMTAPNHSYAMSQAKSWGWMGASEGENQI